MVITGILMFVLLAVPLIAQIITAFRGPYLPFGVKQAQWSVGNFVTLWDLREDFWAVLGTTAVFVGGSTILAMLIAFGLAWIVVRTDSPFRRIIPVLVILPYIIPPIVKARAYQLMVAPDSGILNQLIRAIPGVVAETGPIQPYAFGTIVVIQALNFVTFPFLLLVPILTNMDGGLEESARTSGASWWQTIRRITLPMLWPGVLGVGVLSSILSLGALEIPLLFGQQSGKNIFALKLWNLISPSSGQLPQYGLAAAWGLVFLVATSIAFIVYLRATKDAETKASVSGKGFRPRRLALGRAKAPVLIAVGLFLTITAVLPLLSLAWASVTPYPMGFSIDALLNQASFRAYPQVLSDPEFWKSLGRTIVIAGASATIAVSVATMLAYGVARGKKNWRNKALDLFASSSVAIPATIAGFATFLLFLVTNKWIGLAGTVTAMVIAYSYRVSIAYRTSFSATLQIKRELEEAASTSGASQLQTFRRIVAPLLIPAVAAIWIQMFILGANEFTLPAFLSKPDSRPLSIYVYNMISSRAGGIHAPDRGAAMALLFTVFVALVGYGLQFLQSRRAMAQGSSTGRSRGSGRRLAAVEGALPARKPGEDTPSKHSETTPVQ